MAIKGLGDNGSATDSSLANSVVWAADHGADVISASWGGRGYSALVKDAFDYAKSLGVVCIVAAGNDNADARNYFPASFDNVVTVGASTYTDGRASFSNWGPAVDIAAPGGGTPGDASDGSGTNNILSTMTQGQAIASAGLRVGNLEENKYGYYRIAGTSMACPHVSGVAALVVSARPELTNDEVQALLIATGDDISTDREIGNKRVNAFNAIATDSNPPKAILDINAPNTTLSGKVRGSIDLVGTAKGKGFVRYTLAYRVSGADTWTGFKDRNVPVTNDILHRNFNTTDIVDGSYDFRLQVFMDDGNIYEDFETIFVNNEGALKISSCQQLQNMNNGLNDEYILTTDLDCAETRNWNNGAGFIPIGNRSVPFRGDFNGNGHVVKNLFMNNSDSNGDTGLFGWLDGAEIRKLGLVDVAGSQFSGGLVGYQYNGAEVINTYSSEEALGSGFTGGLIGYSTNSTVTRSYWDKDVSGIETSLVGEPRSTSQMYSRSNFESWDFQDTWSINNGNDYPRLRVFNYNPGLAEENEAPTNIVISEDEVVENSPLNTVIGVVTAIDPNPGDTYTYEILAVDGNTNSDLFILDPITDELLLNGPVDFEAKEVHFVRVQATDFEGLSFTKELQINVLNIIESDEDDDIILSGRELNENSPSGFVVGNLSNLQEANGNTYRYELLIVENNFINRFISPANRYFRIDDENRLVVKEEINYERYTSIPIRQELRETHSY